MNSTTAYIVVCMLLLSALISLILLLLTVSERPDLLPAETPPRRYLDFSAAFGATNATTVAVISASGRIGIMNNETTVTPKLISLSTIGIVDDTVKNFSGDLETTVALQATTGTVISTVVVENMVTPTDLITEAVTVSQKRATVTVNELTDIMSTMSFDKCTTATNSVDQAVTATNGVVETSTATTKTAVPTVTVSSDDSNIDNQRIVTLAKKKKVEPLDTVKPTEEITHFIIDSTVKSLSSNLPVFVETSVEKAVDKLEVDEVTPPAADDTVVLTLERPDATTSPTDGAILAALATTKPSGQLRAARPTARLIDETAMVLGAMGRVEELDHPAGSFGRDGALRILILELYRGRPTVIDTSERSGTVGTSTIAPKTSKFLAILFDDGLLYLPRSDGEITIAHWDPTTNALTAIKTLRTPLKRVHRMKLLSGRNGTARFTVIDGDRPKRVALLDARGEFISSASVDAEIPSAVGAKDICVAENRIYVLSRQALNGSSALFIYDGRLQFLRRVALRTPSGENCNFVEARDSFVYVSCQSAVLRIDTENETVPPQQFGASDGSYALAILPLATKSGRLLAAQRGRAELHLFDEQTAKLTAKLIDSSNANLAGGGDAFFTSLATVADERGGTTIFALEYITGLIHVYHADVDLINGLS